MKSLSVLMLSLLAASSVFAEVGGSLSAQSAPEISCLGKVQGTVLFFDIQSTSAAEFTGVMYPQVDPGDTSSFPCSRQQEDGRKFILCGPSLQGDVYVKIEDTPHGEFASLFDGKPFSQINNWGSLDCRPR